MSWPNWVDLVILTIVLTASYRGVGRGVLAELFNLVGVVSATALSCNYYPLASEKIAPWLSVVKPEILTFSTFLILLVVARCVLVGIVARLLVRLIKCDVTSWITNTGAFLLGGLRGLWWSGLLLLILLATDTPYLKESIEARSLAGPRLVQLSQHSVGWVTQHYPGAVAQAEPVPTLKPQ